MATMLSFIMTDANVNSEDLKSVSKRQLIRVLIESLLMAIKVQMTQY